MEIVYFSLVAVVLYLAADRVVDGVERYLGRRLESRSLLFLGVLLALALTVFAVIRRMGGA